jgi:hypothetical protein
MMLYAWNMEFSAAYLEELEVSRQLQATAEAAAAEAEHEAQLRAEHEALRIRGLGLGTRLAHYYESAQNSPDPIKFSKIASLPMLTEQDFDVQARIGYRLPVQPDRRGPQPVGDETTVQFRLHDPLSGANTAFHNLASFHRNGWIRYGDPAVRKNYLEDLEPGDSRLRAVSHLVGVLSVASFTLED